MTMKTRTPGPGQQSIGVARSAPSQARGADEKLTIAEVCAELKISRSTFYDWRAKRRAPRCINLPNGSLRVRRRDLDRWLGSREDAA
jgi:predicted DNA-binding transcriptional regulator AlpA